MVFPDNQPDLPTSFHRGPSVFSATLARSLALYQISVRLVTISAY